MAVVDGATLSCTAVCFGGPMAGVLWVLFGTLKNNSTGKGGQQQGWCQVGASLAVRQLPCRAPVSPQAMNLSAHSMQK